MESDVAFLLFSLIKLSLDKNQAAFWESLLHITVWGIPGGFSYIERDGDNSVLKKTYVWKNKDYLWKRKKADLKFLFIIIDLC